MALRTRPGYALTELLVGLLAISVAAGLALLASSSGLRFGSAEDGPEDFRYYRLEFDETVDVAALDRAIRQRLGSRAGVPGYGEVRALDGSSNVVIVAFWTSATEPPADMFPLFFELEPTPRAVTFCEGGLANPDAPGESDNGDDLGPSPFGDAS